MNGTERPIRHDAAMAAVILMLGLLLLGLGYLLLERWRISAAHHQGLMFGDAVGFLAAGAGLLIVAWWLISLVLAVASAICQKTGRTTGARVTGRFSPLFMQRLALAVLGLNLLGAPLAQASSSPVEAAWSPSGVSTSIAAAWTPLSHPAVGAVAKTQSAAGPQLVTQVRNSTHGPGSAPGLLEPQWQPRAPVIGPGLMGTNTTRATQQTGSLVAKEVVVMRGDSLWSIAARDLGPMASDVEIARHWPKWYAANKDVIGGDPGLILPGQVLQAPARN